MARSSFVSILNNDDNPSFAVRSSPSFTSYTSISAPPQSDYYPCPFDPVTEAAAQPTSPGSSDCSQDYATSSCGSTIQPTPSDSFAYPFSSATTTPTTTPTSTTTTTTTMTGLSDSRRSPADPPSPQTSSSLSGSKDSRRGIRKNKYPCPYAASHGCASTFTTSGHAARHGKKHTGEKSVHCPICNKAFTRKDNMKQHIRTHRTHSEDMNNNATGEASSTWKRTPSMQRQQQQLHNRSASQSGSGLLNATSRQAPY